MIEVNLTQNTPEWIKFRHSHIGSSDALCIMGQSPWKSESDLFDEKIGLGIEKETTFFMQRGKDLEPIALQKFEEVIGILMMAKVFIHDEYEWMSASLDGIDFENENMVEIKCPGKKDHQIALDGEIPKKYIPQLQHQLAVMGLNKMYYFSYAIDSFKVIEVYKDESYIENLLNKEKDFWKRVEDFNKK